MPPSSNTNHSGIEPAEAVPPRASEGEPLPENYTNRHRDSCPGQDYSGRGRRECGIVFQSMLDSVSASPTRTPKNLYSIPHPEEKASKKWKNFLGCWKSQPGAAFFPLVKGEGQFFGIKFPGWLSKVGVVNRNGFPCGYYLSNFLPWATFAASRCRDLAKRQTSERWH